MNTSADPTRRLGRGMIALAWLAALAVLWLFFGNTLEQRANPNRHIETRPGAADTLVLQRNRSGHYVLPGTINGVPVTFLLDTGATQISVPAELGTRIGLTPGGPAQVLTANGAVTVRTTRIERLAFGPFVVHDVRGHLNPGMQGNTVLLGMNVLGGFEFTQRGGELVLTPLR